MSEKIVIVGGVAGGASAAARLRRVNEEAEIILLEKGPYISFANCGLPYHIGGVIKDRDNLLVQTPEVMGKKFDLDIRVRHEVTDINPENKLVKVLNKTTGEAYTEIYDKLVLATGSQPFWPEIEGCPNEKTFALWNMEDMDEIMAFLKSKRPQKAAVVGGGYVGLEVVENLQKRGITVALIESSNQVMAVFDYEMAQIIHHDLVANGVDLHLNACLQKIDVLGDKVRLYLENEEPFETEMVILAVGVKPQTELAVKAGIAFNSRGGIIVNEYMQTSDKDIYAAGDAVEVTDFVSKEKTMIPLAGPANKQGRVVADNISGLDSVYKGSQGTAVAKIFDLTVASTGLSEKDLAAQGKWLRKDYFAAVVHPLAHAGYYPNATPLSLKIVFSAKDGKVLGAQAIGSEGVDKRIDVLATVIRMEGTIYDLTELELAYAPPFSSAKDPVNMVGFVAENILNGKVKMIYWHEIDDLDLDETIILDVREKEETVMGMIPGAVQISLNELRERLPELERDKKIVIYCAVGIRGYIAARILSAHGFKKVYDLAGGYKTFSCVTRRLEEVCCPEMVDESGFSKACAGQQKVPGAEKKVVEKEVFLDASGLSCPGPIVQINAAMEKLEEGTLLKVKVTDPGFKSDIPSWCKRTNNMLLAVEKEADGYLATLRKGLAEKKETILSKRQDNKTIIVFDGDLDKAIASFIIANGAAAMGRKVTMFFTFWGLTVLRRQEKVKVKKNFMGKMFASMLPRGASKLKLSQMNMGGMGAGMIKKVMRKNNVPSLEEMIQQALSQGVTLMACSMSMDLMGISREELLDEVEIGGVAAYLDASEDADLNLFV